MLLNYEDLSTVRKSVEVEIPADRIASEAKRVTGEFSRHAKIPGFREGKVPLSIVRTRFAKEIQEEVMNRLLPLSFREAISDKGVEPVGDPHLEHMDAFIDGAPLKYKAAFDVKPQFTLHDYKAIDVDDPKIEVSDNDVDEMIERLREQGSSFRPETERGMEEGDYAMIEITASAEGVEPQTNSGHVKLGEETPMPELHDILRGKKAGDTGSFEKAYAEDANNEAFRGKTVKHDVTIKEVRVQEKPEVNDDFARSMGGWDTVEQMREAISTDIRRHRELEALRMKKNQIGDRLIAAHEFEVPDSLVEEELGKSLQNYARYLSSQGVDLEKAELDWAKIGNDFRPEAVKRVKRSLILEQIAKGEGLTVAEVEVDAEIRRAAQENNRDFAEVKHRLKHDGGYEALRASMAQEKALDLVLRESRAK
jgi:trigger factor